MNQQIDRYILGEVLGGGSGGSVYLAEERLPEGIKRTVAVKVFPALRSDDAVTREQFLSEARVLASLGHPQIVTLLNFGIDSVGGRPWIAMEYLPSSLASRITEEPADPQELLRMLMDVAKGLAALHGANPPILHRDVKPANVLYDRHGNYKLADFGLARETQGDRTLDSTTTVRYAAPEMFQPDGRGSAAIDMYAFGHIAYEMALGRRLHREQFPSVLDPLNPTSSGKPNRWIVWHASIGLVAPPVRQLIPDFPENLDRIISRLVAKPLGERFPDALELLQALTGVAPPPARAAVTSPTPAMMPMAASLPARTAAPAGAAPQPPQPFNKRTLMMAATLGVMILIAIAVFFLGAGSPPKIVLPPGTTAFRGTMPDIAFNGRVEHMPAAARLVLWLDGRTSVDVKHAADGSFAGAFRLNMLGTREGELRVMEDEKVLAMAPVTLKREAPAEMEVRIVTEPARAGLSGQLKPAEGTPVSFTTDDAGKATQKIPYGAFHLTAAAEGVQTIDESREPSAEGPVVMTLRIKATHLPVSFAATPTNVQFHIQKSTDKSPTPIELENGKATRLLPLGDYAYRAQADGFDTKSQPFTVGPGKSATITIALTKSVKQFDPTSLRDLEAIEQATLAQLSDKDFMAYMVRNAPLVQLTFERSQKDIQRVRVRGPVFSQPELERLQHRMERAAFRLDLSEVYVDPVAVAGLIQRALRDAGAADASTDDRQKPGGGEPFLRVTFTENAALDKETGRQMARRYVLSDAALGSLIIYPK